MQQQITGAANAAEKLEQLLSQLGPVMTSQQPLLDLIACRPEDTERVVEIITLSPTLSARVLSVINSAALGMPRRIYSIARAVGLLGSARSRFLALAHGLRMMNERIDLPNAALHILWFNSIVKACAARTLCSVIDPPRMHDAFALGLIQDLALPVFVAADIDFYEQRSGDDDWLEAERRHFGMDHAQAAARLLKQWGAAEHLIAQTVNHHDDLFDEKIDAVPNPLQLSTYLASLLPHYKEPMSPRLFGWVAAVHARLLTSEYPSPDVFLGDIQQQARLIQGRQPSDQSANNEKLQQSLIQAVTGDVPNLVINLYKLEGSLSRQQQDMATLKSQALTDPLTGLLNRRGFNTLGEQRLEWSRSSGKGLCAIMGDLDQFKQVNDTYGHSAGDVALAALANLLRSSVRGDDLVGRIGGDEFALLTDQIDPAGAKALAEHLSRNINGRQVLLSDGRQITLNISLGALYISSMGEDESLADLLAGADAAMYHCKHNGKQGVHFVNRDHPSGE